MTQLEKYVVTNPLCTIPEYYSKQVVPLHSKFGEYTFDNSRTVICPLHDDHDPSLGLIKDRNNKGVMLYHCLGCGSTGNVVRFHQRIESMYHHRELTLKESCLELCRLFGIPIPDKDLIDSDDVEKRFYQRLDDIEKHRVDYTERTFANDLRKIRLSGDIDFNRINMACVKMIATKKGLY